MNLEAEKLIYSADLLMKEGKAGDAASLLQECITRFPDAGKAYALMGHICNLYFKDPLTAEDHFKKAMVLAPDFTENYFYYAEALLSQERYTEMTAVLNKGLETTGASKNHIFYLFGLMNEKQSKYEEAVEDYQRAVVYSLNNAEIETYQKAINRAVAKKNSYSI